MTDYALSYSLKMAILKHDLYRIARDGERVTVEVRRRGHPGAHSDFPGRWLNLLLWVPHDYERCVRDAGLAVCDGLTLQAAPARREVWPPGVEGCWLAQTLKYVPGRPAGSFFLATNFIVSYGGELARHEDPLVAFHKLERKFYDALVGEQDGVICGRCGSVNQSQEMACRICQYGVSPTEVRQCGNCKSLFCDPDRHRCPTCHRRST